jgi:penicillin-binding protein 1A
MMILLRTVTRSGTGAAAAQLNHPVGGKTGTTSDYTDAWFLGFSPSVTCGVWIGFDSRQSLGEKETGAKAALPIWMTFMRAAIAGKPDEQFAGDDQNGQSLDQAKTQPLNSGSQKAIPGTARQPRTTAATQVAPHPPATAPGAQSMPVTPPKTPLKRPTTVPASTPQVRPALQLQNTSGRAPTTVKPALAFPQR